MPYAICKTATLRQGQFIPGGKPFEVSLEEVPALREAGLTIIESETSLRPNSGSINNTPEVETTCIPENFPGKISGSEELFDSGSPKMLSGAKSSATQVMGNSSGKAKTVSKASSKKEG